MRLIDADAVIERLIPELEKLEQSHDETSVFEQPSSVALYGALLQEVGAIIDILKEQPTIDVPQWIPFEFRDPDDAEREAHPDWNCVLCGELPEDWQEILVSSKGRVWEDAFLKENNECYLDSNLEIIEGMAWTPLPEPYKKVEKHD